MRRTVRCCFQVAVTLVILLRFFPARVAEQLKVSTSDSGTAKIVRLDPGDWHQLDNFCAVHIVLEEAESPIAVLLAQHNHHHPYLIGCDLILPADERLVFTAEQRSNELCPDRGETTPMRHRTIRWAGYVEYLLSGKKRPWFPADYITYGRTAGSAILVMLRTERAA